MNNFRLSNEQWGKPMEVGQYLPHYALVKQVVALQKQLMLKTALAEKYKRQLTYLLAMTNGEHRPQNVPVKVQMITDNWLDEQMQNALIKFKKVPVKTYKNRATNSQILQSPKAQKRNKNRSQNEKILHGDINRATGSQFLQSSKIAKKKKRIKKRDKDYIIYEDNKEAVYMKLAMLRNQVYDQKCEFEETVKLMREENEALCNEKCEKLTRSLIILFRVLSELRSRHKTFREDIDDKLKEIVQVIDEEPKKNTSKCAELVSMIADGMDKGVIIRHLNAFGESYSSLIPALNQIIGKAKKLTKADLKRDDWSSLSAITEDTTIQVSETEDFDLNNVIKKSEQSFISVEDVPFVERSV